MIEEVLKRGKICANDYNERAKILCDIFIFPKKLCTRTIITLNTNCNAAHLTEFIFQNMPSITNIYECDECGYTYSRTSAICNINVNEILNNGLNNIQNAINDEVITKLTTHCKQCRKGVRYNIAYGVHLILDISVLTDSNYVKSLGTKQPKYTLQDLTKTIIVDGHTYDLSGIVNYIEYKDTPYNGHYVAYTSAGNFWYKYNDMMSKRSIATSKQEISPHVIVYIKNNQ